MLHLIFSNFIEDLILVLNQFLYLLNSLGHIDHFILDQSIRQQLLLASELPDFSELLRFQIEFIKGLNHYPPFDFGLSVSQNQELVVGASVSNAGDSVN